MVNIFKQTTNVASLSFRTCFEQAQPSSIQLTVVLCEAWLTVLFHAVGSRFHSCLFFKLDCFCISINFMEINIFSNFELPVLSTHFPSTNKFFCVSTTCCAIAIKLGETFYSFIF